MSCSHNISSLKEESVYVEKIKVYKLISMYTYIDITISIDDYKVFGKSAINDYWANCQIDGDLISLDMIKTTRKTDNAEKRRIEGDYLSILQTARAFKIEDNKLIIYTTFIDEPLIYEEFAEIEKPQF